MQRSMRLRMGEVWGQGGAQRLRMGRSVWLSQGRSMGRLWSASRGCTWA